MKLMEKISAAKANANTALIYSEDKTPVSVRLDHVSKIYEDPKTHRHFYAVKDSNIVIQPGEFVTLLGPSGCGKTTTLRMIAGFESPDEGQIYIGDVPINAMTPNQRDTAMVFQSYALFPHLNVFDNVAYGLKLRKLQTPRVDENGNPVLEIDKGQIKRIEKIIKDLEKKLNAKDLSEENKESLTRELEIQKKLLVETMNTPVQAYDYRDFTKDEIRAKVTAMLELVELPGMEERMTNQLSGGQQQRVALARALILNPSVLLFDEPLSNLDAKLRVSMRTEIRKIQKKVGITAIYVTHDQSEAMALSDRIIIMNKGFISQIGSPKEVYYQPKNEFVADFIGEVNFIEGSVIDMDETNITVKADNHFITMKNQFNFKKDDEVKLVLRPEAAHLTDSGDIKVEVILSTFMGSYQL
ncbi:MAG: ABC transporter ATP-binding protein, partial [Candidatus Enterosoma sp.]|nr:ABC transporter ATP-binding protein [bacterium]MDY5909352.1 ABC transporter ATP-binding protein [Candidatus Enterosoma sp.]